MTSTPTYIWLCIGIVFYTFGEYVSKLFSSTTGTKHSAFALVTIVAYALSSIAWLFIMSQKNHLLSMSLVWQASGTVTTTVLALAVFGERLTVQQWIGFALFVAASVLLWE